MTQAVPRVPTDAQRVFAVASGQWFEGGTVVVETCPGYDPAVVPTTTGAGVFFSRRAFDALAAEMARQQAERDAAQARVARLERDLAACRRRADRAIKLPARPLP